MRLMENDFKNYGGSKLKKKNRKHTDKEILKAKAIFMYARHVLQMNNGDSQSLAISQMKIQKSKIPPASIRMYCGDLEKIEMSIVRKRFDKAKIKKVIEYIDNL